MVFIYEPKSIIKTTTKTTRWIPLYAKYVIRLKMCSIMKNPILIGARFALRKCLALYVIAGILPKMMASAVAVAGFYVEPAKVNAMKNVMLAV